MAGEINIFGKLVSAYVVGDKKGPLIDYSAIDNVPIAIFTVGSDDELWEERTDGKFMYKIQQDAHDMKTIHTIEADKKVAEDFYENMVYSYKRYTSGTVSIITDEKIDMRVIIKGEK